MIRTEDAIGLVPRRGTQVVAREIVKAGASWYVAVSTLARRHGWTWTWMWTGWMIGRGSWRRWLKKLAGVEWRVRAGALESRNPLYPSLNPESKPADLMEDESHPLWVLRSILNLKGALLALNAPRTLCSTCNADAEENILHFFGVLLSAG